MTRYIIFHGLRDFDLKGIEESGCKMIAPSVGITKIPKIAFKYGDFAFVTDDLSVLKNFDIYTRDIYSPTIRNVPEKIYRVNMKYLSTLEPDLSLELQKYVDECRCSNDPRECLRLYIMNEYDLMQIIERKVSKISREYIKKGMDEYKAWDKAEEEIIDTILDNTYVEVPETPSNIAQWLQDCKEEVGGEGMNFPLIYAAQKIDWKDIPKYDSLLDNHYKEFEGYTEEQWEILDSLTQKYMPLDYKNNPFMAIDYMATWVSMCIAKNKDKYSFTRCMQSYIPEFKIDDTTFKNIVKYILNTPVPYFEAKTLSVVDPNLFKYLVVIDDDSNIDTAMQFKKCFHNPMVAIKRELIDEMDDASYLNQFWSML